MMLLQRISSILLVSTALCLALGEAGIPTDTTLVANNHVESAVTAAPTKTREQDRLLPVLQKKQNTAAIGSALYAGGLLISYGLVYPKAQGIEPEEIGDQLALISPSILASGLRYVGSGMACMRTSEAVELYENINGESAPRNLSWYLWFSGWGFYLGALGVQAYGMQTGDTDFAQLAQYPALASDVAFGAACVYSWFYIRNLGKRARSVAHRNRVRILPVVSAEGDPGLQLLVKF